MISFFIRYPMFANAITFFVLFSGMVAIPKLKREMIPVFAKDKIIITVPYPNAQPQEVEEQICIKIENVLRNIAQIDTVESSAEQNIATVICSLKTDSNVETILDEVKRRIDTITTFPEDVLAPNIEILEERVILLRMFLYGELPKENLYTLAKHIEDELVALPGVENLEVRGMRDKQINIEVSEYTLQQYNCSFSSIIETIRQSSLNISAGKIQTKQGERNLYVNSLLYQTKDYENIPIITNIDGAQIFLRDLAKITMSLEETKHEYYYDNHFAINFRIYTPKYYDSLQMVEGVKDYVESISLPENVHLIIDTDFSVVIRDTVDLLFKNALLGILLVLVCLLLFLDFKLAIWVSMGVLVSFSGGLAIMWICDYSLNMISIFALIMVLGIVVDDAIVVGENIKIQNQTMPPHMAAVFGAKEVIAPIFACIVTTTIAFVPLFFVPGTSGKWIREIPVAAVAIIIISFLEALFILPSHLSKGFSQKKPHFIRRELERFINYVANNLYKPLYYKSIQFPIVVIVIILATLIICYGVINGKHVKFTFFPKLDSENIYVDVEFASGTPRKTILAELKKIIDIIPKVDNFFTKDKKSPIISNYYGLDSNTGFVALKLRRAEERSYHSEEIIQEWKKLIGQIPGTYSMNFFGDNVTPGGHPIEIQLFSEEKQSLEKAAYQVKLELNKINGVYSILDDTPPGRYTLLPIVKEKYLALGISQQEIAQLLIHGYAGGEVYKLQERRNEVKVLVKYQKVTPETSLDPNSITLTVNQKKIPLSEMVYWQVKRGQEKIRRKNNQRSITIHANVDERTILAETTIATLKVKILDSLGTHYHGVSYVIGGQSKESEESLQSLKVSLLYAVIAIFLIIALNFQSYLQALIILFILPFSIIGAIAGHWIMGHPLSSMSFFGIVALCGVIVNDSILIVERINSNIRNGYSLNEAICEAGPRRFRAIMITTITTVCGLLPLLFEKSLKAHSLIPMAISICFGLAFATLITLFLVPVLYKYLNTLRCVVAWLYSGTYPDKKEKVEPAFYNHSFQAQDKEIKKI